MTLFGNVEDRTLSVLDHQETRETGPGPPVRVYAREINLPMSMHLNKFSIQQIIEGFARQFV